RVPAGGARAAGDAPERRRPRRAAPGGRGAAADLRSSEPAPRLVTVPYELARWELVPGHTALVLIDDQRDFLHPDGWYAKSGIDISHMRRVIEPTQRLVAASRAARVPVIWTRHGTRGVDDGGPFMQLRPFLRDGGLRRGTWGYDIHDDLDVRPEDWIVEKIRLSAFFNTDLEVVLRGLRAETVLIGGVLTN